MWVDVVLSGFMRVVGGKGMVGIMEWWKDGYLSGEKNVGLV